MASEWADEELDADDDASSPRGGAPSALSAEAAAIVLAQRREMIPGVVRARAEAFVEAERTVNAQERFVVGIRTRVMSERVEQHQTTEHALHVLAADVQDAMGKGMRSRHALDALEARVLRMRGAIRSANDAQDALEEATARAKRGDSGPLAALRAASEGADATSVIGRSKTAAQTVDDELSSLGLPGGDMEQCPKCSRFHLPGFLRLHLIDCEGGTGGDGSDSSESEGGGGEGGGGDFGGGEILSGSGLSYAASRAAAARAALSRATLQQCPICLRKFAAVRVAKHRERCEQKAILETTLNAQVKGTVLPLHLARAPSPLISIRILAPTSSTIPLVWEPPVDDGGSPIADYHVRLIR